MLLPDALYGAEWCGKLWRVGAVSQGADGRKEDEGGQLEGEGGSRVAAWGIEVGGTFENQGPGAPAGAGTNPGSCFNLGDGQRPVPLQSAL